jgi:hypothetical protein
MPMIFERVELHGGPLDGMRWTQPITDPDDDSVYEFQAYGIPDDFFEFVWYRRTRERTADGFTVWRLREEPRIDKCKTYR